MRCVDRLGLACMPHSISCVCHLLPADETKSHLTRGLAWAQTNRQLSQMIILYTELSLPVKVI